MGVTRRFWGELALAGVLAASAAFLERPVLLVGAAGVAGWVVAQQYAFVRSVAAVAADVSVTQLPDRERITADETVRVGLAVELPDASPVGLEVEASPPVGTRESDGNRTATLRVGECRAATEFAVRVPLAGDFPFGRPAVTATDAAGRFRATFDADSTPTVTANPRRPVDIHVGAGGERLAGSHGEYSSDERGVGLELAEIRAYVPGDTLRHVDWNATARFGRPFVREFQAETDRRIALFVDCRPSMGDGPEGVTKFDYAREVGLGIVEDARERGSPIDVVPVGEDGVLARESVSPSDARYETAERYLRTLDAEGGARGARNGRGAKRTRTVSPAVARRRASRLRGDESPFAATLEPFFASADPYVERVAGDPLYAAVRRRLGGAAGADLSVVLTDDANRAEIREVAKAARRNGNHAAIFLTPTVLFEDGAFDAERAHDRYADFERFRRSLAGMDRVSAFEVGPDDRLEALVAAGPTRPTTARGRASAGDRA